MAIEKRWRLSDPFLSSTRGIVLFQGKAGVKETSISKGADGWEKVYKRYEIKKPYWRSYLRRFEMKRQERMKRDEEIIREWKAAEPFE